jgi:hypothetical protein
VGVVCAPVFYRRRNGALCLERLPIDELLANPQVKSVLRELAKANGVPFRSWYEEMAADRFDPPSTAEEED